MTLEIKKIIVYGFLCVYLCSKIYTIAKEDSKQSVNDMKYTAGVETILNIKIPIEISVKENSINYIGYTTAKANIREKPSTESKIMNTLPFNTEIQYAKYNEEWVMIEYENARRYVYRKYISNNPATYTTYNISNSSNFKSYMPYKAITNKSSKQYKLQQKTYTGDYGIRMIDDRYCVALGSHFQKEIGTYFDLVLENGTVIKCVLGDIKSEKDTYEDNITSFNGCVSEFIVDSNHLIDKVKVSGDISNCNNKWDSTVIKINFYDKQNKIK